MDLRAPETWKSSRAPDDDSSNRADLAHALDKNFQIVRAIKKQGFSREQSEELDKKQEIHRLPTLLRDEPRLQPQQNLNSLTSELRHIEQQLRTDPKALDSLPSEVKDVLLSIAERVHALQAATTYPLPEPELSDEMRELAATYPFDPIPAATEELASRPNRGFDWLGWARRHYGRWIDAGLLEATELDRLHPMQEGTTSASRSLKNYLATKMERRMKLTDVFPSHGEAEDNRAVAKVFIPDRGSLETQIARTLGRQYSRANRKKSP